MLSLTLIFRNFHLAARGADRWRQVPQPTLQSASACLAILTVSVFGLRLTGELAVHVVALAEEDEVASQLRDEELRNAAGQIRALSTTAHKGAVA